MFKRLKLRNRKIVSITNMLENKIKPMLRHKIFEARFQVFLWVVTLVSICMNVYLVVSKLDIEDLEQEEFAENLYTDVDAKVEQASQGVVAEVKVEEKLLPDSNGMIKIELSQGDSLHKVLQLAQVPVADIDAISKAIGKIIPSSHIRQGSRVEIEMLEFFKETQIAKPKKVSIYQDVNKIEANYDTASDTFIAKRSTLPLQWEVKLVSTQINGSLYASARKAGADPNVIAQLINLFSHNVDFQRDLQIGDVVQIMYEYQTDFRGKVAKNHKILYASLNLSSAKKEVYRHELPSGSIDYFDAKGNSVKRSLLRTPINGAKIASHYGPRVHPVLGYSRMHKGLDYSAPRGTPILAAGDGVVEFVKNQARGYGKHVQIKHNANYATLYGHMSRFASNVKPNTRVKQGEVIGYVGDTGLATGPHLHYEVIENGHKVNPTKMKVPTILPLKGVELAKFKEGMRKVEQMVAQLDDNKINAVAQVSRY